jgi:hypothetical protein
MAEIVQGLFGVSPDIFRKQQDAQFRAQALAEAQLNPEQQNYYQMANMGRQAGRAIGSLFGAEDPALARQSAENALLQQVQSSLSPADLQDPYKLSAAVYEAAMAANLPELANNAYQNLQVAQNQAIAQNFGQGVTAQQLQNQAIGQNFGQGLSAQQLQNSAIAQNLQSGLAGLQTRNDARNANISNAMQAQAMQNAAMQQNYGQAANLAGLYNSAAAQQYNQNMQRAQFGNTASDQALARALQLRNQPLNEITALMGASQIQNPQFQGYTGANVSAAPVYQAVGDQGNYAMGIYGQKMAARNANVNAVGQAVGTVGTAIAMSDMRLKSNIERVGTHANGVGVYEYDIDGHRERGVMAQEVLQVKPEAVTMRDDGFYMVNYGAL